MCRSHSDKDSCDWSTLSLPTYSYTFLQPSAYFCLMDQLQEIFIYSYEHLYHFSLCGMSIPKPLSLILTVRHNCRASHMSTNTHTSVLCTHRVPYRANVQPLIHFNGQQDPMQQENKFWWMKVTWSGTLNFTETHTHTVHLYSTALKRADSGWKNLTFVLLITSDTSFMFVHSKKYCRTQQSSIYTPIYLSDLVSLQLPATTSSLFHPSQC